MSIIDVKLSDEEAIKKDTPKIAEKTKGVFLPSVQLWGIHVLDTDKKVIAIVPFNNSSFVCEGDTIKIEFKFGDIIK